MSRELSYCVSENTRDMIRNHYETKTFSRQNGANKNTNQN